MCGFSGVYHLDGAPAAAERDLVRRMTQVLTHRGPDDHGVLTNGPLALGHRRLSVIDLSSNGRQPMANEDESVWIAFNGEVYNYRELKDRHRLVEKGHRFRSLTDTEVLLHLYEERGPAMAEDLNGMFAFVIWDARRRQLHLARDRHGIKPLFYSRQGDRLLFGSEIKAILQDERVPRRVNPQALHDFLTFDYIPGAQTAFEGIEELPPAHWMTIGPGGAESLRRYWNLRFEENEAISERHAVEGARALMAQAVKRQLVSDVPIGVLLSGGMDSSTLVAIMSRHTKEPVRTYSVGFEEASFNELPYARKVSGHFGTVPREVLITPQLVQELLPGYLHFIDEPYADGSAIPTYYVCQQARRDVVVVLSGEGGDEVFAGYDTHAAYKASRWFARIPRWVRQRLIAPMVNSLPVSHKKLSLEFKMKRFLGGQDLAPAAAHLWWRIVLSEQQKRALYTPKVLDTLDVEPSDRHFHRVFDASEARDILNRLLLIDSSVFLPDDLMIKNDRMSMAHSVEARVPFTDNDLVEFMAHVPARMKLPGMNKKRIMKQAMAGVLPREIINKKKVGLEMPYSAWLRKELKSLLAKYCSRDRVAATGLFRPEAVQSLIDHHHSGRCDNGRALWGLLNYMMWLDIYHAS